MDWIDLSQDRDQWRRALVNTIMNFRIPLNVGKFATAAQLAASEEEPSSIKLVSAFLFFRFHKKCKIIGAPEFHLASCTEFIMAPPPEIGQ
jgi:hypothetical protein